MGQDISLFVIPTLVPTDTILDIVRSAVAPSTAGNLVVVFGGGTARPGSSFPPHTAFTLWTDTDIPLDLVATDLSAAVPGDCLIVTAADHSCVGVWVLYRSGRLHSQQWSTGDGYLEIGAEALQQLLGTSVTLDPLSAVGVLADPGVGYCLRSTSASIRAGGTLSAATLVAVTEDSVPGVTFECALAVPS